MRRKDTPESGKNGCWKLMRRNLLQSTTMWMMEMSLTSGPSANLIVSLQLHHLLKSCRIICISVLYVMCRWRSKRAPSPFRCDAAPRIQYLKPKSFELGYPSPNGPPFSARCGSNSQVSPPALLWRARRPPLCKGRFENCAQSAFAINAASASRSACGMVSPSLERRHSTSSGKRAHSLRMR